jgi:hypothetical protein
MAHVLVRFGHPAARQPRVQRARCDAVGTVPDVVVHDLYEA